MPAYLDRREASELFSWLTYFPPWRCESLTLFGRRRLTPRLVAWYGDAGLDYQYSRRSHPAHGWPEPLEPLRQRLSEDLDERFNFVLLNRYRNGDDCMGWHRDDEAGVDAQIASISLGASRRFLLRKETDSTSTPIDLEDGSLLIFDGSIRHCLPRTRRASTERINLTFRSLR